MTEGRIYRYPQKFGSPVLLKLKIKLIVFKLESFVQRESL